MVSTSNNSNRIRFVHSWKISKQEIHSSKSEDLLLSPTFSAVHNSLPYYFQLYLVPSNPVILGLKYVGSLIKIADEHSIKVAFSTKKNTDEPISYEFVMQKPRCKLVWEYRPRMKSPVGDRKKLAPVQLTSMTKNDIFGNSDFIFSVKIKMNATHFNPASVKFVTNPEPIAKKYQEAICDEVTAQDFKLVSSSGEEIRCHKSVLKRVSDVFSAMIDAPMTERDRSEAHIEDLSTPVLKEIVTFAYTGFYSEEFSSLSPDLIMEVVYGAEKYNLTALKKLCDIYLVKLFSITDGIQWLMFSQQYQLQNLNQLARNVVFDHWDSMKKSEAGKAVKKQKALHDQLSLTEAERMKSK